MQKNPYIFGGDTGLTYDALKRRRKMAESMLARASGQTPRNVGEGLSVLGQAIGGRMGLNRANRQMKRLADAGGLVTTSEPARPDAPAALFNSASKLHLPRRKR